MAKRLVVVLGMHRSGTSMVTGVVAACGISAGENMMPASSDNPNGYWEDLTIVSINEKLLQLLGREWSSLDTYVAANFEALEEFNALSLQAKEYLAALLNCFGEVVIKDPRLCVLFPFWQPIIASLGCEVVYILVRRDPAAIVASLESRDSMPATYAVQLIFLYWLGVSRYVVDDPSTYWVSVDYDRMMEQCGDQVDPLVRLLGKKPAEVRKAFGLINRHMNHYQGKVAEPVSDAFSWQQDFFSDYPCGLGRENEVRLESLLPLLRQWYYKPVRQQINQGQVPMSLALAMAASRPLYIWGAGSGGRSVRTLLSSHGVQVSCFLDSDSSKWGSQVFGLNVCSPEIINHDFEKSSRPYVIIGSSFLMEIKPILEGWGYNDSEDFCAGFSL